jgi:signal transduction histidine kinase
VVAPRFGIGASPSGEAIVESRLLESFSQRGVRPLVDLGPGIDPLGADDLKVALPALRSSLAEIVATGRLGFAWTTIGGTSSLVVAGRLPPSGPEFYFVRDTTELEATLLRLRLALGGIALVLVLVALVAGRRIASGVLAPIEAAGRAAARIEGGDLSARVAVVSDDEFGAWAERFNRMAASLAETIGRLEAAQVQNRRFVADVAHELRTPLAALVAEASILREHLDALTGDGRRAGELLIDDVARLRTLVEELMELSRFDAAAEQAVSEPVDLGRLVRLVAASRMPGANLRLPSDPIIVDSDQRRVERILANLLDNAREHGADPSAEVSLDIAPGEIVLAVADRGPGVPADQVGRIFDRFYKADPSRAAGGSGLGLAIAAEHAAVLGGRLVARKRDGGGLRIELHLPVTRSLPAGDVAETAMGEPDEAVSVTREPTP